MDHTIFSDSIVEASAKIIAASLPFMTMGMIGHPALLIAAGSTGCVALFVFLIRILVLFKKDSKVIPVLDRIINSLLFPYVFALSFSIGIAYGEANGWYGIWFSLFLAGWIIVANCIAYKKGIDKE